ncbi:hypothetical protein CBQ28_03450 [Pseudoalteromonas sp. GCY]|uniref:hypothetical protein n=1 Tax=Pseudoalteromonas sp. GCY TaxID=2003316 RepID=UPI000BFF0760|nr:hypothetical protein [Pseudoalteromonas sp. GCY]PHI38584.1 hypothetical protein CBQ28_03450 [Pseudoalteromonas sp. GCY]QQQ67681.1 hypothetical protein JJQ94_07655 [Pseudoalteromonas sp. GCY]
MIDLKNNLRNELNAVSISISSKEQEVAKAKRKYDISFSCTVGIPVMLLIWQMCATSDSIIIDHSDPVLWAAVKDTFSVTIGSFGIFAALTGMLGFNHRAKQLDLQQLRASKQTIMTELQFELSNDQFKLANKQFNLATVQNKTNQARENLKLYYEHVKIFETELEHIADRLERLHGEPHNLGIDSRQLYKTFFVNNSPVNGVLAHDPVWPIEANSWEGMSCGSFQCYLNQLKLYIKNYPLLPDAMADFKYEVRVLVDIYNTLANFGFAKLIKEKSITDQKTQFKYVTDLVFMYDFLNQLGLLSLAQRNEILGCTYDIFGGLFWPYQVKSISANLED